MSQNEAAGWHSRGYLPHIEAGERPQFVIWRLLDSIPSQVIEGWRQELAREPPDRRKKELYSRIERFLDEGHGSCVLRNPACAKIVQDGLLFHHCVRYELHAWSIMANHVHVLLTPALGVTLGKAIGPLKGYSSNQINRAIGDSGQLWEIEYYDTLIRNEEHFRRVVKYIEWNPVKACLCADPKHWPYSSANPTALERVAAKSREFQRKEPGQSKD